MGYRSPGQIAYEAFIIGVQPGEWRSWETLSENMQARWEKAAIAVQLISPHVERSEAVASARHFLSELRALQVTSIVAVQDPQFWGMLIDALDAIVIALES